MTSKQMAGENRVLKGLKVLAQRYINVGFFLGFFLVLLTYFTVSEQFALSAPNAFAKTPSSSHPSQITPAKPDPKDAPDQESGGAVEKVRLEPSPDLLKQNRDAETPADESTMEEAWKNSTLSKEDDSDDNFRSLGTGREDDDKGPVPGTGREDADKGGGQDSPAFGLPETEKTKEVVAPENEPMCQVEDFHSDTCDITGDVRTHGASLTVLVVPARSVERHEWHVRPYSRKHMESIKKATVKVLGSPQEAPPCSINQTVPALLFATGGLIGNFWHDFTDVLVPVFIASRKFDGEVQFLVSNIQRWWIAKYSNIFDSLTRYEIIDIDKDNLIRCYPHAIVGTQMHKELSIDPGRAPGGYSMVNFTEFLRKAYSLPRSAPIRLSGDSSDRKPRLMYIQRFHYRRVLNVPDVVALAESLGFDVTVADPKTSIAEFAKTMNSFDVLVGMHGAGLTNAVFLPTDAVLIQIVPYGKLEHMAQTDFGIPAVDMGLKYIEYSVSAEESTLSDMFGKDDPVIRDPEAVHRSGWDKVAEYYLGKQDVRVDVNRFAPFLQQALDHLRR